MSGWSASPAPVWGEGVPIWNGARSGKGLEEVGWLTLPSIGVEKVNQGWGQLGWGLQVDQGPWGTELASGKGRGGGFG